MAATKGNKGAHSFFGDSADYHLSVGSYEGGSCLNGHLSQWKEGDSCSYRWQGLRQAEAHPGPYNAHPNSDCHLGGSGIGTPAVSSLDKGQAGVVIAFLEAARMYTKTPKTGKNAGKAVQALKRKTLTRNFTNGFAPYGNQVHHVLPNAVLSEGITEVTQSNADLVKDICDGLMMEMYNINFHINMLILPTKNSDSRKTGLPTHCGSHPSYSNTVKAGVKAALRPYAAAASKGKDHPPADYEALKSELEAISNSTYADLVAWGQATIKNQAALAVNDVPSAIIGLAG